MHTRRVAVLIAPVLLMSAFAHADINGFGSLSSASWALNSPDASSPPTYDPATQTLRLTNPGDSERRSIFSRQKHSIGSFTASFTYQAKNIVSNFGETFGACFVLQNSSSGANAVGGDTAGLGYSGIGKSVAITLAIGGSNGTTGLFKNGTIGGGATSTGLVSLASGHAINVFLSYDGTFLTQVLTDTVTNATYGSSYLIDIPATVGSGSAYVGLTASTVGVNLGGGADQYFSNFNFGPRVPAPGTLLVPGIGLLGLRRRR